MQLRNKIDKFIQVKIGNGMRCNVWFDRWCLDGPIIKILNQRVIELAGLSLDNCISDMIHNNVWKWPDDWVGNYDNSS